MYMHIVTYICNITLILTCRHTELYLDSVSHIHIYSFTTFCMLPTNGIFKLNHKFKVAKFSHLKHRRLYHTVACIQNNIFKLATNYCDTCEKTAIISNIDSYVKKHEIYSPES